MFLRRLCTVFALGLGAIVSSACASEAEETGDAEDAVELERGRVESFARLAETLAGRQTLEAKSSALIGVRDRQRFEAVRSEIGVLAEETRSLLEQLRERLASPTLPIALKRNGYLDVPDATVRAQLDRVVEALAKIKAIEPAALALTVVDEANLARSVDELVTRVFGVAPAMQEISREFRRWLQDFAARMRPEWRESFLTLLPGGNASEVALRVEQYRARLRQVFPDTLEEAALDPSGGQLAIGFARFAGRRGGEDRRLHELRVTGASEAAWFSACLDALSASPSRALPGRKVVAASCGVATPELNGVSSKLTYVTIPAR